MIPSTTLTPPVTDDPDVTPEITPEITPDITEPVTSAPVREDGYTVQIGAFRFEENARRYVRRLEQLGFQTYVEVRDGLYRVQTDVYSSLAEAQKVETILQHFGFETYILQTNVTIKRN